MWCKFCVNLAGPFQGLSDKGIEEMLLKCTFKRVPPTLGWQPSSTGHPLHGLDWDYSCVVWKSWILAPPYPFFAVCTCSTWASTFSFVNRRTTSLDSRSVSLDIKWSAVSEGVCQGELHKLGDQDGCETHCLPQQRLDQGARAGPILDHPDLTIILPTLSPYTTYNVRSTQPTTIRCPFETMGTHPATPRTPRPKPGVDGESMNTSMPQGEAPPLWPPIKMWKCNK